MTRLIGFIGLIVLLLSDGPRAEARPMVYTAVTVDAPLDRVWADWTTAAGLESHYAPKAIVELKPGGAYEIWFLPDAPKGQRGAEDGVILGLQDNANSSSKMIQFTWRMPPYMPEIIDHMTVVQMWFDPQSQTETRIRLYHTGFGDTPKWDEAERYFTDVWPQVLSDYQAHITKNASHDP